MYDSYIGIRRWTLEIWNFFLPRTIRLKLSANFSHSKRKCYKSKFWLFASIEWCKNSWLSKQLVLRKNITHGLYRYQNDRHDLPSSFPVMMSYFDDVMYKWWRHEWRLISPIFLWNKFENKMMEIRREIDRNNSIYYKNAIFLPIWPFSSTYWHDFQRKK